MNGFGFVILLAVFSCSQVWLKPACTEQSFAPKEEVQNRSVVDKNREELLGKYSELKKTLEFTVDQSNLHRILNRVGQNVDALFNTLPDVSCIEEVTCLVKGPVKERDFTYNKSASNRFLYLMLASSGDDLIPREYRTNLDGTTDLPNIGEEFLLTSGFVGQTIHLHPKNQSGSRFRYLGRTSEPKAHLIAFAQIPASSKNIGRFLTSESEVMTPVQGLVWVDPASYQILRIHTDLLTPYPEIGLSEEITEIDFEEVRLALIHLWLPVEVEVRVVFRGYTFRNRHRYSEHKLFSVETKYDVE